jgi:hypothetical protein
VKKPLSREMLFGKLKQGGISFLTLEDDVLQLSSEALPAVSTIDFKIAQSP